MCMNFTFCVLVGTFKVPSKYCLDSQFGHQLALFSIGVKKKAVVVTPHGKPGEKLQLLTHSEFCLVF